LHRQDHTEFHQNPLSAKDLAAGFTRPYRWHMDAPLYEKLPGQVTTLHCLEIPELSDQRLRFADGSTMPVAAGATACMHIRSTTSHLKIVRLIRGQSFRVIGLSSYCQRNNNISLSTLQFTTRQKHTNGCVIARRLTMD